MADDAILLYEKEQVVCGKRKEAKGE